MMVSPTEMMVMDTDSGKETLPIGEASFVLDYSLLWQAIDDRKKMDSEELAEVLEIALSHSFFTLRLCKKLVGEMQVRFQKLSRKRNPDGSHATIRGCRSFQEWCRKVLHRTEQAVYLMLRQPEPFTPKEQPTNVSNPRKFIRFALRLSIYTKFCEAARILKMSPEELGVVAVHSWYLRFDRRMYEEARRLPAWAGTQDGVPLTADEDELQGVS